MKLHTLLFLTAYGLVTNGFLLHDESGLEEPDATAKGPTIERRQQKIRGLGVGYGDRFKGGEIKPKGLGERRGPSGLDKILNVEEVESALKGLRKKYPDKLEFSPAEKKTFENRTIFVASVGTESARKNPRVFLTGGMHGDERGGSDNLIYFVSDLLWAEANQAGLSYGQNTYSAEEVKKAFSVGIKFIPLVNPDGTAYDHKTNRCWRKNRNAANSSGEKFGVDINRNFVVFEDRKRLLGKDSSVFSGANVPSTSMYPGPEPGSEPETQAVSEILHNTPSLSWYMDLHSSLGKILYAWGIDRSQTDRPEQSFTNKTYDGQRGLRDDQRDGEYKEYIEKDDLEVQKSVTQQMAEAMSKGRSKPTWPEYSTKEAVEIYVALGSSDEAMVGYYGKKCGANRIHGLTLEFGDTKRGDCSGKHPTAELYKQNVEQTAVGMMELLLRASTKDGEPKLWRCEDQKEAAGPAEGSGPQKGNGASASQSEGPPKTGNGGSSSRPEQPQTDSDDCINEEDLKQEAPERQKGTGASRPRPKRPQEDKGRIVFHNK
ncbi:hypothetical protein CDD83_121 [Cordyceps sp. RAO-2017]|nr:hypothetical protein CDD83_121 [Cordyceps sp. RAO-2017]